MTRAIKKLLRKLLIKCPKCSDGRLRQDELEQIGTVWVNVYTCDKCGEKFI